MDWLISILGIWSLWLLGNKNRNGWLVKIACGVPWVILVVQHRLWGLMIPTVITGLISARNYLRWKNGDV